jgi:hypothetical protein
VAHFFALLRPICRYSFDIHGLGQRELRRPGFRRRLTISIEINNSSAGLFGTGLPINGLRAARQLGPLVRDKFEWSANALGMQGECASDALGTSQECASFGP